MSDAIARLVDQGDVDELTRLVDRLCRGGDWDGLVELGRRARAALARGRQLWPVAAHVEYRLALDAPGPWAARTLEPGAGRFAPGPLSEVAASTHTWAELAPHAPAGPVAGLAAHERVVRGEDLRHDPRVDAGALELPLVLEGWEPDYPVASYAAAEAHFPSPPPVRTVPVRLPAPAARLAPDDACAALLEVTAPWTTESDGRAEVVAVEGTAAGAVAALGVASARMAPLDRGAAVARLAWAGASGGAHGRRRGAAVGRFSAWWALAALAGALDGWPLPPGALGRASAGLRWHEWDAGEPPTGWALHLAVEDPARGRAWAVAASDAA